MLTRWGRDLDPEDVLQEYPRPQLVRDSYLNLNGRWDYAITAADASEPASYDGTIVVPFSPEAPLSGVNRQLLPDQTLWYRRSLVLPDGFLPQGFAAGSSHRVLLHSGAVDQTCRVLLDGIEVGANTGGYLPFTCDLTDALRRGPASDPGGPEGEAGHTLVVAVRDVSDTSHHSRGKQRLDRGDIWYTAQSGIWQTVWAESVPLLHVDHLDLVPDLDGAALDVTVHGEEGTAYVEVLDGDRVVAEASMPTGHPTRVPLPDARPWTPEDPFLYDVRVRLGQDRVTSYVGMRSFGVGPDAAGTPRLLLNGAPYFHAGVLDQGYWPDGLLTAPSDAAMVHDIETMRDLGFTMLRKHIKIEPLRWYYHCDRLGMLVWQDMVNGGATYRDWVTRPSRRTPKRLSDRHHRVFGRRDVSGRAEFEAEVRRTVEHLRNAVSVAVWVPFNEGWGQFNARRIADAITALDPTRPVDHASGWHDQGGGHLRSVHVYDRPFRAPTGTADARPLVLSEYGGYNLRIEEHTWNDQDFGYRRLTTVEALAEAFLRLHADEIVPAIGAGLSASVYTQLSDVEDELNGLLTYDREVLKLAPDLVRSLTAVLSF